MQLTKLNSDAKILEVGCANGKDFIQFANKKKYKIYAVDINEYEFENVKFINADAENLPFPDKSFDLVVSVGLLEHIEPVEKLCRIIREFDRVGKHQVSIVPSISTVIEPHCGSFRFPMKLHKNMCANDNNLRLNYFTEHTWTKFEGFLGCKVKRFYYIPPFIKNTVIYK